MRSSLRSFAIGFAALATAFAAAAETFQPPPIVEEVRDDAGALVSRVRITRLAELEDTRINESSGLAFSRRDDGLLWTQNDSGDGPNVFALDLKGRSRGFFVLDGATAVDWEDIASFEADGRPYLLLADFGDNGEQRDVRTLYIVEEPAPGDGIGHATNVPVAQRIDFDYEKGKHDCEAIAVDPDGSTIILITKKKKKACKVYQLDRPAAADASERLVAREIGSLDIQKVTGMDIARDGSRAIVLTYEQAFVFEREPGQSWADAFAGTPRRIVVPWRSQGESICFGPRADTLYLTSENTPTPLWKVELLTDEPPAKPE